MAIDSLLRRQRFISEVVSKRCSYSEAARSLGVTPRTIHNYVIRFIEHGPEGLKDRRKGNHRKVTVAEEAAIVELKKRGPQRSARSIQDHLRLSVCEETVRLILVKHGLNRRDPQSSPAAA
jgi:transposase